VGVPLTASERSIAGCRAGLLHASRLNADTIGEILALFRRRGCEFVTLAEAMRDPAYAIPETKVTKFGPM